MPAADAFDCDDVAFRAVSDAAQSVSRVEQVAVAIGATAPLAQIPREGTKLFVATGFGGDDVPVVRACAELGTIEHDVDLELVGEPVTLVDAQAPALGEPLPPTVRVDVTDLVGRPQANAVVTWEVVGPGGQPAADLAVTGPGGVAAVPTTSAATAGPVAMLASARWMSDPPQPVVGFNPPTRTVVPVPAAPAGLGRNDRHQIGRVGPAGQIGFALIAQPSGGGPGRAVVIAYRDGDDFTTVESPPVVGLVAIGVAPRAGRDEVFSVVADQWLEFRPDGTVGQVMLATTGITADEIAAAGPCPAGVDDGIALVRSGTALVAIDAAHEVVASEFAEPPDAPMDGGPTEDVLSILGSGCATTTTGALRRVVVYRREGAAPVVKADVGAGVPQAVWPTAASSVGFSRALPGRSAPLLGVELDTAGVSIVRYELVASGGALQLQEIDADDAITLPDGPVGGDIDADGGLDVVAVLPTAGGADNAVRFRIMIALSATVGQPGTRVAGVSTEIELRGRSVLELVDVDSDGDDDLVLIGDDSVIVMVMGE